MNTHASRRGVDLIGAACGRGGADAGCAQGPARLRAAGIDTQLRGFGAEVAWSTSLETRGGGSPLVVSRFCALLAAEVSRSLGAGRLPCVIGGDHSIAVGTWTGVAAHARGGEAAGAGTTEASLGLVWIDAHLDSHTPGTSPTGRLHGMPVATLLGQGDDQLSGFAAAVVSPKHLCLVGARRFEPVERALLDRLGVRVIDSRELRQRGLAASLDEALAIAGAASGGYGVSLDLDAIDPAEAPGVATPVPKGIGLAELAQGLHSIAADPRLLALEIAEYCPRRDREGTTERAVIELLSAWLGDRSRDQAEVFAHALDAQNA